MISDEKDFEYEGFTSPNGTIVPDAVFDILMPKLKDGELRVLLYIIRRTFGFMKQSDNISLRQMVEGIKTRDGRVLDGGTGLKKSAVAVALAGLREKKIIKVVHRNTPTKGHEPTTYQLRFIGEAVEETLVETEKISPSTPLSGKPDKPLSTTADIPLSGKPDIQQTVIQQTEISNSNIRMRTHANFNVDNSIANVDKLAYTALGSSTPNRSTPTSGGEIESVGSVLKRGRGRPSKEAYDENRERIFAYINDFARELGDNAPLKSSVTRAYNLYRASGTSIEMFTDAMYQAKAKTKEHSASIRTKRATGDAWAPKAKMGYWFSVLEQELGLEREKPTALQMEAPN